MRRKKFICVKVKTSENVVPARVVEGRNFFVGGKTTFLKFLIRRRNMNFILLLCVSAILCSAVARKTEFF